MLKQIERKGKKLAIVFKKEREDSEEGINFFTSSDNNFQAGILKHSQGHIIPPHIHIKSEKIILDRQEMLYIEKGKIKVNLCDEQGETLCEEILNSGDFILLISGGHGFEFLETSRIIYVKQGPYVSKEEDKIVFEK